VEICRIRVEEFNVKGFIVALPFLPQIGLIHGLGGRYCCGIAWAQAGEVNANWFGDFFRRKGASDLARRFQKYELRKAPRADFKLLVVEENGHFSETMHSIGIHPPVFIPKTHRFVANFEL